MAQHRDAVSAYSALNDYIATSLRGLVDGDANPLEAPQGVDGRQSLFNSAEVVSADAQKITLVFMGKAPSAEDAIGLCKRLAESIKKFVAWCIAVGGQSASMQKEVVKHAEDVLLAVQRCVKRVLELNLKAEPEPFLIGAVMETVNEMVKKLPTSQVKAVQRRMLENAAAVKSVVDDLEEMIQENTDPDKIAERVDDMGMDEEGVERNAFDDMMDMNVNLSREELVVANAALSLSKTCMQVLKVGVKKLMGGAVTGCSAHYEDLSQASSIFTRAAEDLGANCVFELGACRGDAEKLVRGLEGARQALEEINGSVAVVELDEALRQATQDLAKIPP